MNNSSSNDTVVYDLYSNTDKIIGTSLAYAILGSVALIGNMMVLIVVFLNNSMRTTINVLLVNLSFSDILYLLFCVPAFLASEICNGRWTFGLGMAIVAQGVAILSPSASILTLISIAVERYFAIVHPLKDRTRNKKRTTCWALIIIWLLSMALALPFAIKTTLKVVPLNIEENGVVTKRELSFLDTKMDINNFRIYYLTLFISLHIVPFVSMAALYTRIAWQLWKRSKDLTAQTHNNPTEGTKNTPRMSERNRRRTTKMVIAVLLAFFICFFPFHIYYLTILLGDGYKTPDPTTTLVLRLLLILNAAVNPIIYNLLSENFRAAFRAMCACGTRENRGSSVASLEDGLRSIGNSGYN